MQRVLSYSKTFEMILLKDPSIWLIAEVEKYYFIVKVYHIHENFFFFLFNFFYLSCYFFLTYCLLFFIIV